jgi:proline iminopeptidase
VVAESSRVRRAARRGLRGAGWAAAAGVTLLTWLVGTLAAASITSVSALFLVAGTVLAVAVWLLTCRLLLQDRSGRRAAAVRLAGVLAVVALLVAVLVPLRDPVVAPATPPGAGTWRLGDGATLAHGVVRAADPTPGAAPVVALHGGPGVSDTAGLLAALGPLAADGRDVWSYDQRGAGRSTRLADPSGYTTQRAVADLEQVRRRIGAERMVLVGHSWGAYLAAAYLAQHPDRVQRAVFLSPGALSEHGLGGQPQARLTTAQRWAVYRLLVAPRALLAYALVQVSPAAAHALADDPEVDARQDRVYAATAPALHCPGRTGPALSGLGFYAGVVPQSWRAPPEPDVAAALADTGVPALVVKGRCDYLDWASAVEYLDAFPDSRLVYLPGAGHNLHEDDPVGLVAAVRAFLAGRPVPGALDDPSTPPADYQT